MKRNHIRRLREFPELLFRSLSIFCIVLTSACTAELHIVDNATKGGVVDVAPVPDLTPDLDITWVANLDLTGVALNTSVKSSIVLIRGIDPVKIPITISGEDTAEVEVRKNLSATWMSVGASYSDLEINDEIRLKMMSSDSILTTRTATVRIGQHVPLDWHVTTMSSLPPSSPHLTHANGMNSFQISWGDGGIGNGGTGGCKLQYLKNSVVWMDLGGSYDCDSAQSSTDVILPGDGWTDNFSGVSVRLARISDGASVIVFATELSCSAGILPSVDDPNKDESCDGNWTNDADMQLPIGGAFTISATDENGTSSLTGSTNVLLNISCPADQAGGVEMAFGNSSSPSNWAICTPTKSHLLTTGSGAKTVYVRFRDAYGNTTADLTRVIALDQTAPVGGSVEFNPTTRTELTSVSLNLTCATDDHGPVEIAYGTSSGPTNWTTCWPSLPFTLQGGDGLKTAYVRYRDLLGNISAELTATVILDQTAPIASLGYIDGWTTSSHLDLTVSTADAQNSTPLTCEIEKQQALISDGVAGIYGAFTNVSNSCAGTSTIAVNDGYAYRFRIRATDSLGNRSAWVTSAFETKVDVNPPFISSVTASSSACNSVLVTVSAGELYDADSGLAPSAYSFDGGTSWQIANAKTYSTTSLSLSPGQIRVRDIAGNIASYASTVAGTSASCDPCGGSVTPGTVCTGDTIFIGSLSPGATSGSGTDKYMTTPGGCGEIPAGQIVGSGPSAYPNADFTPSCAGTDYLTKYWNDGTMNYAVVPGLTDYTNTSGTGYGSSNKDINYGSTNTTKIAAVTDPGSGGYHAAARYCDKLSYGGYSDWFLPNRYELNLMYTNRASIPGLNTSSSIWYWSSTEYGNTHAWIQTFSDGYQTNGGKNVGNFYVVRCVRKY